MKSLSKDSAIYKEGRNCEFNLSREVNFRDFYTRYVNMFYLFAHDFVENSDDAEDVMQYAFSELWNHRDSIHDPEYAKAFMYTIIRRRCKNLLRHRRVTHLFRDNYRNLCDDDLFYESAIEHEVYDLLRQEVELLSPMQSSVVKMSVEGYSNDEIAQQLNISVNTVLTHKQRAKQQLKQQLDKFLVALILFN